MATLKRLAGKVAIVTGSSSGLGRAISQAYAREGAQVVCADLSPQPRLREGTDNSPNTDELLRQDGHSVIFQHTDVGEASSMKALVDAAVARYGRLDIMVNNAGVSLEARQPALIHETSESTWDTTMQINAKSVFLGCKYSIAQMMRQVPHASGDRGWIVNISSIMGLIGGYLNSSYSASKGAVTNLTRQVAIDYGPHRIRCNAICPGHIKTAIFTETINNMTPVEVLNERHPLGGAGTAEDVAKFAVVLGSDDASWVTGAQIAVDGGYTAR